MTEQAPQPTEICRLQAYCTFAQGLHSQGVIPFPGTNLCEFMEGNEACQEAFNRYIGEKVQRGDDVVDLR